MGFIFRVIPLKFFLDMLFRGCYSLVERMFWWNRRGGVVEFVDKTYKRILLYNNEQVVPGLGRNKKRGFHVDMEAKHKQ